ncbi:MAG TPA: orotidine-5'-phosphate decarboxylase [Alphaproteobacteria bacterium]|nr:orotidine-5'-phosphate decarboxylase [Alphaproteobacteria bacterium]
MCPALSPERLIVALDTPDPHKAIMLVQTLMPTGCLFKVGMQLASVALTGSFRLQTLGIPAGRLMLDLKLWDTPDTVSKTALYLCQKLQPRFFTIPLPYNHPSLVAAVRQLKAECPETTLLGVTVPTSMDRTAVWEASDGLYADNNATERAVTHFAALGAVAKLAGVVCSAHEVGPLMAFGFTVFVTPGIRPAGAQSHDQQRTATPAQALAAGATHLVIGRPITQAENPRAALEAILAA